MMIGAVQLGIMAACVVLFVPVGMAVWHLSRNKMLFFSCALFVTLAVGVHLMPYFPSISSSLTSSDVIPAPTMIYRDLCVSFLHAVVYRECSGGTIDSDNHENGCKSWDWIRSDLIKECEFQKMKKSDASDLLNGSWVVVSGDSQARLIVVSLLELVMGSEYIDRIHKDLFKRHKDYSVMVEEVGMKLDFVWAPYVRNLTKLVLSLKMNKNFPDVLVMGAGLWDMLHMNNETKYGNSLHALRNTLLPIWPVSSNLDAGGGGGSNDFKSAHSLHMFWIGMPTLISSMLNTPKKRNRMTEAMCSSYGSELSESKLLSQSGGQLLKLDIRLLSELCGPRCKVDGMHYDGAVYNAAVHIMLNALLIDSNQKPQL